MRFRAVRGGRAPPGNAHRATGRMRAKAGELGARRYSPRPNKVRGMAVRMAARASAAFSDAQSRPGLTAAV
ncbi:hypothetical protein K270103H11_23400 [Gordonibacter urolithinfaciens]